MADVDWAAIKTEYLTTKTSYRKLAAKYGVHYQSIASRSSIEGWVSDKNVTAQSVVDKAITKISDKHAAKLVRLMSVTDKVIDIAESAVNDSLQFNRYIVPVRQEDGSTYPELQFAKADAEALKEFTKLDTKALKEFTGALKDLTGLVRNLYGLPTQAEAESQRVAAERLVLDKGRADASDNREISEIKVIFESLDGDDTSPGEADQWGE